MEHIFPNLFLNGYNLINTTIYVFFVFLGSQLFFKLLKKYLPEIKVDKHFIFSVLSFVLLGSLLRILEQEYTGVWLIKHSNSPLEIGFYFHTPGWLLLLSVLFLVSFLISIILSRSKKDYYKILIPIGLCLSLLLLVYEFIHINHLFVLIITFFSVVLIFFIFVFLFKKFKIKILDSLENKLLVLSQIIDFSATLIGLFFFKGVLYEQHPVSRIVIGISPILFPFFKLFLIFILIILIDRHIEEKEGNIYTKLIVIVLGFLTGIRDILTISLLLI